MEVLKKELKFSAKQIAKIVDGIVEGNEDVKVCQFRQIEQMDEGGLAFLTERKYEHFILECKGGVIIVSNDYNSEGKDLKCTLIRVKDPQKAIIKVMQLISDLKPQRFGISKHAIVSKSASIGQGTYIGDGSVVEDNAIIGEDTKIYPQVYIGNNVSIGEGTLIYAGAKIYEGCKIGNNCIIHSGVVIGSDGFGFSHNENGTYVKIPQLGIVIIEDDVEIGANTCIDRAMFEATIIREGSKLDNLIQIAHNCQIGKNTVIAAECGIAGSVSIGNNCVIGGQVGIKDHVKIGNNVQIASQSGIHRNVKDKSRLMGTPAIIANSSGMRAYGSWHNIPDMLERLSKIEQYLQKEKDLEDK